MPCHLQCSLIRCPSCRPALPPTAAAPLLRRIAITPHCCPCRACGAWALVLDSGAESPYYLCYACYDCAPTPAQSRWRAGRPAHLNHAAQSQISLF